MSEITAPLFWLSVFLSCTWGSYFAWTIHDYAKTKGKSDRHQGDVVAALRRAVVAGDLWMMVFSYAFRTLSVQMGVGNEEVAQIIFFALVGTNIVGSLFAILSIAFQPD